MRGHQRQRAGGSKTSGMACEWVKSWSANVAATLAAAWRATALRRWARLWRQGVRARECDCNERGRTTTSRMVGIIARTAFFFHSKSGDSALGISPRLGVPISALTAPGISPSAGQRTYLRLIVPPAALGISRGGMAGTCARARSHMLHVI